MRFDSSWQLSNIKQKMYFVTYSNTRIDIFNGYQKTTFVNTMLIYFDLLIAIIILGIFSLNKSILDYHNHPSNWLLISYLDANFKRWFRNRIIFHWQSEWHVPCCINKNRRIQEVMPISNMIDVFILNEKGIESKRKSSFNLLG